MKHSLLLLLLLLCAMHDLKAQDQLVLKDSSIITCKVGEFIDGNILYKKWSDLNGATYIIDGKLVNHIVYQERENKTFTEPRQVAHTFKYQSGAGIFVTRQSEMRVYDGKGFSGSGFGRLSAYLDQRKTVSFSTTLFVSAGEFTDIGYEKARINYLGIGFMNTWQFHWLRWSKGSLYSGAGVGFIKEDYSYYATGPLADPSRFVDGTNMSYQFNFIGLEYAPFKHFGFFSELGFGYEGVFKLGYQIQR